MIDFTCPGCGEPMSVPYCLAGKTDTCPGCGRAVPVPEQPIARADAGIGLSEFEDLLQPEEPSGRLRADISSTEKDICRVIARHKDLEQLVLQLARRKRLGDRHFLYLDAVRHAYRQRKQSVAMRDVCESLAWDHLREFPRITRSLRREFGDLPPQVPTFQQLATLLTEKGEYDKAVGVCQQAIRYGLCDGTQGGYAGRIERIRKRQPAQDDETP